MVGKLERKIINICVAKLRNSPLLRAFRALILNTFHLNFSRPDLFRGSLDLIQAETFSQWVLGGRFAIRIPDLNKAGVEVVVDVAPFAEAKIRILNSGHTALGCFSALAGFKLLMTQYKTQTCISVLITTGNVKCRRV